MSKYRSTFVRGVFVGCLAGTLLLIASSLVFRGVSLSFYGEETDGELLAEGRSLLSLEGLFGNDEGEVTMKSSGSYEKEQAILITSTSVRDSTRDETLDQQPKKPLLIIVTTTKSLLERTSNRIRTSWGSVGNAQYRIIVGTEGTTSLNTIDIPQVVVSAHHDFPAFPYLSISNLSALLDLVTNNYIEEYKWFLLAPSNMYVSVQSLERFLQGLNPYKVVYIGRPSNHNMPNDLQYCEGGPGIIFSHMALRKLKGRLQGCVGNSKGDLGYRELGKCLISELKTECFMSKDVSYFHKPLVYVLRQQCHK